MGIANVVWIIKTNLNDLHKVTGKKRFGIFEFHH